MADLTENFITYSAEFFHKKDEFEESDFGDSPHSDDSGSTLYPPSSHFFYQNPPPFYSDFRTHNFMSQPKTFNPVQPFQIIKVKKEESEESIDVKIEEGEGLSTKSKRILKREKAKQRTKCKQDTTSFLSQVSSKYIPEGFDDPTIDEKTKKKMIQMIRNRISAQNSRDRKKAYMHELEILKQRLHEENRRVNNERDEVLKQFRELQEANLRLLQENEELRKKQFESCLHCGKSQVASSPSDGNSGASTDDFSMETISLSSPTNFTRTSHMKNPMHFMFALATILACVMVNANNTQPSLGLQPTPALPEPRMLTQSVNPLVEKKDQPPCLKFSDISPTSVMMNNIRPLKKEFNENHLVVFKGEMEKNKLIMNPSFTGFEPQIKIEEPETALMEFKEIGFLSTNEPHKIQNLPIMDPRNMMSSQTSSLLCPYGLELLDEEEKKMNTHDMEDENEARFGKLGSSKYLQLWIPKRSLNKYNLGEMSHELPSDAQNDNSILELWCNVYFVRELSANF